MAPEIIACDALGSYPLIRSSANEIIRPRSIVLGNAAQTLHPLLAQGLNLAYAHIHLLAGHLKEKTDPGSWQLLRQYQHQALQLRDTTMCAVDSVQRLVTSGIPLHPAIHLLHTLQPVPRQFSQGCQWL